MKVSFRVPVISRKTYNALEVATRPSSGKLAGFVEISGTGEFDERGQVSQVSVKIDTEIWDPELARTYQKKHERQTTLEELGGVLEVFGFFPASGNDIKGKIIENAREEIEHILHYIQAKERNEISLRMALMGIESVCKRLLSSMR